MERENVKCIVWIVTTEEFRDILYQMVFVNKAVAIEKAEELAKEYSCKKVYEDGEEINYHDDDCIFINIRKSLLY